MTTSFLEIIAHEDDNSALNLRKATVTAKTRVEQRFGSFLRGATSHEDFRARCAHVQDDVLSIIAATKDEFGVEDNGAIATAINASYIKPPQPKEASVHESRKPKMCPFHKDVVDISLAAGDAKAGFDSMAQHWGGPRHCEGDGYEGGNCNFKPQMTTQAYWDDKAEKAEERKQQRAEQAELEAQQSEEIDTNGEQEESVEDHAPDSVPVDALEDTEETPAADGAEVIPFPSQEAGEPVGEVPMSMAAGTHHAAQFQVFLRGQGGFKTAEVVEANDEWEARQRAIQQSVSKGNPPAWCESVAPVTTARVADAGPVPKMDKRRWGPSTLKKLDVDDEGGPNPTKRKDVVEAVHPSNGESRFDPSPLEEIGEQVTEHQDVTEKGGPAKTDQGGSWSEGPKTAVSTTIPNDVDKNPIKALMEGDYDGFIPQNVVQQAIAARKA
jgi:hypothetical protein